MGSSRISIAAILLGIFLLSLSQSVLGRFVVEKNSLRVTSPDNIKGAYDSAIGNFGIPQYGGCMAGTVLYPKENQKGCRAFDGFGISFKPKPGALPTFLLLDRGDCFFALKVWNAQNAGASAVLVADDIDEDLITMDSPAENGYSEKYFQSMTIPSALIEKSFGMLLKQSINGGDMVNVNLDWSEAVPHPDDRVEYELWTNSNDECGFKCDMLMDFVKDFKGAAQILEKGGYTQFTPHYITWCCPQAFSVSKQCKSQCINHGRYCAHDLEQDFSTGYDGKDVVIENLRQLCVFKVASETNKPWVWWDYVTDFQIRCPMKEKKYNKECADSVIKSLGLDLKKIEKCMGDPSADSDNLVLKGEQHAQIGKGSRGDVTILPTLVVNNRQYRGKLEKGAVLKALCAGFEETTEPSVCLSNDVETKECLDNNGGCWQDKAANVTACKDTFRGRVCECPVVNGVQFKGDGYNSCKASGLERCKINNGGCWHETRDGRTFSACLDNEEGKCTCPLGFKGDGFKSCDDIDECKEKKACQCAECNCKNTWGSYDCTCSGRDLLYIRDHDTCISKRTTEVKFAWIAIWINLIGLGMAAGGGYLIYKHRLRYLGSELVFSSAFELDLTMAPCKTAGKSLVSRMVAGGSFINRKKGVVAATIQRLMATVTTAVPEVPAITLPSAALPVIELEPKETRDVDDQQILEERRKEKQSAGGSNLKRKIVAEGAEEEEEEEIEEIIWPNWKIKVDESCDNAEGAKDFLNCLPPTDAEKMKSLTNLECVQSFMVRRYQAMALGTEIVRRLAASFQVNCNLRAEREKNKEELGLLHIAKDKAEVDLEKVKDELAAANKMVKEAEEKLMKEHEACMKWETEAKRVTERYETPNGHINATTEKTVLEAFLKDKRCGNLFTRISRPVVGEAFKYLCQRIQQEVEPSFQLPDDLTEIVEAAEANVYPWDGGEFNLDELMEALLEEEENDGNNEANESVQPPSTQE